MGWWRLIRAFFTNQLTAEEEALKLVLTSEGCKRDDTLKVSPRQSRWTFTQSESRRSISPFPFLVTFINLACIAYKNHGKDDEDLCKLLSRLELSGTVPEGFELLAVAENPTFGNGYYGVAYINRKTSQIILSHRGTEITNWGAVKTDLKSIWWGYYTPQVSSAITFAHMVARFALMNHCQLFFTGHSLGAWLAQITCFSLKYLTLNGSGYFVRKSSDLWEDLHPYTVAFDSPGALQFLLKMKDHFFPRNEPQSQMINVACLPVEVFQFYPNSINSVNTQVGSVYIVDLDKAGVKYSYVRWYGMKKWVTMKTHGKDPVNKMMTENAGMSETEVLRCQVVDWRVDKLDDFLHKWGQEGRSVPVELHKFAQYHLTREESKLLEKHNVKEVDGGCYEGLSSDDENVANRIVEYCKRGGVFAKGSVQLGENVDRREVIPQVRQLAQALKNEVIWWNPTKLPVPENYIGRSVAETRHLESEGRLPSSVLKRKSVSQSVSSSEDDDDDDFESESDGSLDSSVPQKRLEELVEPLVLLVDPPGMGKSSEMSYLDQKLRKKVSSNRVILRVNLNVVQTALKLISSNESASRVLLKLAPFLPTNIFETAGVRVFVLLDGLDEVCPAHQTTMINLLRMFTSIEEFSLRVGATVRSHLRGVVEEQFKLKSWSLLYLTEEEQDEYMKSALKKSSDEISGIHSNLLRILNSREEQSTCSLRVFLTTRPHLRRVMEDEFNRKSSSLLPQEFRVESYSLLPLTVEEQDKYMKSVLNKSREEISGIRSQLTESVSDLLGIPLMLSMFVDVIKSGGDFTGETLNTFNLYTRFVEAKHKLQLVEKEGMGADDNYTAIRLEGMLERRGCLPHYYRAAIYQLVDSEINRERVFRECRGIVAQEEPSELTRLELISLGLLIEGSDARSLVFKHRSFAEFFYARLLTAEDRLPQGARDALFGSIYAGRNTLENVEAFVAASLLSKRSPPPTTLPAPLLLLPLSPNWILCTENDYYKRRMFLKFVESSRLFPLLVREVLLTFVTGDAGDQGKVLEALFDKENTRALEKLCLWMTENKEWTREELFKMNQVGTTPTATSRYPMGVAWLMEAISRLEGQELLSEEEVGVAINCCDRRLVSIVAKGPNRRSGWGKWEWVEGNLPGGRTKLRELFTKADADDLFLIVRDVESAWKLVQILSGEEISALLTNEETRVSDICGRSPLDLVVVLGEESLPPKQLAQFRGKFGEDKGKTVFEMSEGGCVFALKYLWGELVGEVRRGDETGPVTVAWREALGRMGEKDACEMLLKLEGEVLRRRRRCRRGQEGQNEVRNFVVAMVAVGGVLMEWVAKGLQRHERLYVSSLETLPLLLRYMGSVNLTQLNVILKYQVNLYYDVEAVLRSLVVATSSPRLFSFLSDLFRENFSSIPQKLQSLVGVFLNATREQIAEVAHPFKLVSEVSVGGVFLTLLPQHHQQQHSKATWVLITRDVIEKTLCCDLPVVLNQLRRQMEEQAEEGARLLKKVLTSKDVLSKWSGQFNVCRVTNILSFYFSVFGHNLQWMKMIDGVEMEAKGWVLLTDLPVEIATVLPTELLPTELLPQFKQILREHLRQSGVVSVIGVARTFSYQTDANWETLLPLIDGHTLLPGERVNTEDIFSPKIKNLSKLSYKTDDDDTDDEWESLPPVKRVSTETISSAVAAPLLRTFIRLYGEEWTKQRLTNIWDFIPSRAKDPSDSVGSLGSLLHSAITLGKLEEVERRAWPAVVKWRNAEGKSAFELAKDKWEEEELHPIRLFLHKLTPPPLKPHP